MTSAPDWQTDVVAYAVHTDVKQTGRFTSSDIALNNLHAANTRTYLNNLQGIPTDCPTRENTGWGADAQLAMETGLFNFDTTAFYEKYLGDLRDGQETAAAVSGAMPVFVPAVSAGRITGPYSWQDPWWGGTIARAWTLRRFSGDDKVVGANDDALKAYVDRLKATGANTYLKSGSFNDWLAPTRTDSIAVGTAAFYRSALILSQQAAVLGRSEDQTTYGTLAAAIRDAFNTRYFNNTTKKYNVTTQTLVALALGMEPSGSTQTVAQQLVDRITATPGAFAGSKGRNVREDHPVTPVATSPHAVLAAFPALDLTTRRGKSRCAPPARRGGKAGIAPERQGHQPRVSGVSPFAGVVDSSSPVPPKSRSTWGPIARRP